MDTKKNDTAFCNRHSGGDLVVMLKKDLIALCLLHLLDGKDQYGYELLHILHEGFPDTQESAIYALLREMCRNELIQWYKGDISGGPVRKYYRLTDAGREKRKILLEEWQRIRDTVASLGVE